jgi:hypothetical protein
MMRYWFSAAAVAAALVLCLLAPLSLAAQKDAALPAGGPEVVIWESYHDTSPPLREMLRLYPQAPLAERHPLPRASASSRNYTEVEDPVRQTSVPEKREKLAATIGLNFDGMDFNDSPCGCVPPDSNGAVGATQYFQLINTAYQILDKSTGAVIVSPTTTNSIWSGFGGGCENNNDGDATVTYDKAAGRWVVAQFSVSSTPYTECMAISTTDDATGPWYRYAFQFGSTDYPDYPKVGVWPAEFSGAGSGAYAATYRTTVSSVYNGPNLCVYNRNAMLNGLTASSACFQESASYNPVLPVDLDGVTIPPANEPVWFMTYDTNQKALDLWAVTPSFPTGSTISGPTQITVAAFTPSASTVAEPSPGEALETMSDRPMYRLAYRNFLTKEALALVHTVGSPAGIRWYEIDNPAGTPTVAQQGTYAPNSNSRWMASTAMDVAGDQAIGYSVVNSSTLDPSVAVAGRTPSDAANTLEAEISVVTGGGVQEDSSGYWGEYSAMQVDPVNDCTFWYTQEYYATTSGSLGGYNTRIASFKFPTCGAGTATTTTLTTSSNPAPTGLPVTFTATVSPSPGTGGTMVFTSFGTMISGCSSVTLSGGIATCTTLFSTNGNYSIVATYLGDTNYNRSTSNTLTQVVSTVVTVTSSKNPSVADQSVTFTATVLPNPGATGTMEFTVTNSGTTTLCASVSVNASGVATCTATSLPSGSDSIKATYSGGGSGTLVQTVSPTQLLVNGGFGTGSLSPWTGSTGGCSPVITQYKVSSGSTYSAAMGSTVHSTCAAGEDFLYQAVAIPAAATSATLTGWYWSKTSNTNYKDDYYAIAIKNTSGTTLKNCLIVASNSQTWTESTCNLNAYIGQTIRIFTAVYNSTSSTMEGVYEDNFSLNIQ